MNLFHSTVPVHTHSDHNEESKKKKRTEDLPVQQPVKQPSEKERKKRKKGTKDTKE